MNLSEAHYCAKCFSCLPEEMVCPVCGHDPEQVFPPYLLEEGTLLQRQRYQVGVVREEGRQFCVYAAWDHRLQCPVRIKEYFPKCWLKRDITQSDEVEVKPGMKQAYHLALYDFLHMERNEDIIDTILHHGVGYQVYKW